MLWRRDNQQCRPCADRTRALLCSNSSLTLTSDLSNSPHGDVIGSLPKPRKPLSDSLSGDSNAGDAYESNTNIPEFEYLHRSYCGIKTFPYFIQETEHLHILNLSHNDTSEHMPSWLCNRELQCFLICENQIEGIDTPSNDTELIDSSLEGLNVSHNRISGPIPTFTCNFRALQVVDMSDNQIANNVPNCFHNNFRKQGEILLESDVQGLQLRMLYVNTNFLSGKIQKSLSNVCRELKVVDLGNNQLNDTFPLSRILDFSNNMFSGSLPAQLLTNLLAMKVINSTSDSTFVDNFIVSYLLGGTRSVSQTQRVEGNDVVFRKLTEELTIIDLFNNLFIEDIPKERGELKGLRGLDISSNKSSGSIPKSLGNMTELKALDVSDNHLLGSIPIELSRLAFLAVLNLWLNDLQGSMPQGNRFNSFDESSFKGSPNLCCSQVEKQILVDVADGTSKQQAFGGGEENNQEEEVQWLYEAAGVVFGAGLGILSLPILFMKKLGNWYWNQIDKIAKYLFYFCYLIIYGRSYNRV